MEETKHTDRLGNVVELGDQIVALYGTYFQVGIVVRCTEQKFEYLAIHNNNNNDGFVEELLESFSLRIAKKYRNEVVFKAVSAKVFPCSEGFLKFTEEERQKLQELVREVGMTFDFDYFTLLTKNELDKHHDIWQIEDAQQYTLRQLTRQLEKQL